MAVVKVDCKKLKSNPHCPHGPTLKFVRAQGDSRHEFFACSAYRNRKDCSFYLPVGEKSSNQAWTQEKQKVLPSIDIRVCGSILEEVKAAPAKCRVYCHSCGELDLMSRRASHLSHDLQIGVSNTDLLHPSKILRPKQESKKEAQFWFSSSTTQVIVNNLVRAGVNRVLCLGTPRVHEHISSHQPSHMQSILLDMDHRYHSFWPMEKFIWFNMFNRHILSEDRAEANRVLWKFLCDTSKAALVLDPPFGGHLDPLAATVRHFLRLTSNSLIVIWIFPYFREGQIIERCPSLTMLDYKVQYENHKEFTNGVGGRKLGSPVRLFTNMDASQFELPSSEGYRLCDSCDRWVAAENRHCLSCNNCSSKYGRTYIHCDDCGTCVKPQWRHCVTCQRCLPALHSHDVSNIGEVILEQQRHKRSKKSQQEVFKKKIPRKRKKK